MIVARIDGGLGNQMFQYAFGLQLAHRHATELVLDLSSYEDRPAHGYLLDCFSIEATELPDDQRTRLPSRYRARSATAVQRRSWRDWWRTQSLTRLREKPFGFSERYLHAGDDRYLVGYWQSERFFPDVHAELRRQFQPRSAPSAVVQKLQERLLRTPTVALHVRRGDYITNPQASSLYRHLSLSYYQRCIEMHLRERSGVQALVFSNDIAWCQQNLSLPCPTLYTPELIGKGEPHEEMWLMTAAEAVVTANSTFSWWGAWLNPRTDKRIYSPRRWFSDGTLDDSHLPCAGWTLVDDPQHDTALRQCA